jgi:hypothetical protein
MKEESKNVKIVVIKNRNLWVIILKLIVLANIVHDTYGTRILSHYYFRITSHYCFFILDSGSLSDYQQNIYSMT